MLLIDCHHLSTSWVERAFTKDQNMFLILQIIVSSIIFLCVCVKLCRLLWKRLDLIVDILIFYCCSTVIALAPIMLTVIPSTWKYFRFHMILKWFTVRCNLKSSMHWYTSHLILTNVWPKHIQRLVNSNKVRLPTIQ